VEKWDNFAFRQSPASHLPQQFRQLGEVRRNAPGLIARQQVSRPAAILEIHADERVAVEVAHDKAGVFVLFDLPQRRQAASSRDANRLCVASTPKILRSSSRQFCLTGVEAGQRIWLWPMRRLGNSMMRGVALEKQ
jgi:hypothetical protein